ncbi:MAG TPA: hypothetical protein VGO15_10470, partial [Candidatus Limnocylindrales bacterium]|nr:hypothetical protein [Candidatus Limnocylindrales bacterium]
MTIAPAVSPMASEATARALDFVALHRDRAEELGASLAESINDPDAFAVALTAGFAALADPAYRLGQRRI